MQPVPVPDLWDQLGFLVTKILGGDSYSIFPLIKDKNSLSPHTFARLIEDNNFEGGCFRRDAAHVRQGGNNAS
jgi:hypothetical protein